MTSRRGDMGTQGAAKKEEVDEMEPASMVAAPVVEA